MTSPIVVQIDSELKEKAMKMAKKEGLTMKALLSFLLKWYTQQEIILTSRRRWVAHPHFEWEDFTSEENNFLNSAEVQEKYKKLSVLWM